MSLSGYYVSAIDVPARALVAGPYPDHATALARVQRVKRVWVRRYNPRAWFWAWGTARVLTEGERVPRRLVRLPLFIAPPSEGRFRVYVDGSGRFATRQAGEDAPGPHWTELARVNMPRGSQPPWNAYEAVCEAIVRAQPGRF